VLVGDKGYNHWEELSVPAKGDPHLALHGSFSLMANLHAARLFTLLAGGFSLHTPFLEGFKCAMFVLPGRNGSGAGGGARLPGAPPPPTTPEALGEREVEGGERKRRGCGVE
jgi:hypothetical protein